jgi:uncharacterized protein (TIGR00369 family)
MTSDSLRNIVENMIPFVKKVGVTVDELTATKVKLRLAYEPTNLNPLGIVHAGALFTLAETAAGAICLSALGTSVLFIAKSVDVRFRRPAKGDVTATAQMTPLDAQRIVDTAKREGKLDAPIAVELVDSHAEPVTTATVVMSVRRV